MVIEGPRHIENQRFLRSDEYPPKQSIQTVEQSEIEIDFLGGHIQTSQDFLRQCPCRIEERLIFVLLSNCRRFAPQSVIQRIPCTRPDEHSGVVAEESGDDSFFCRIFQSLKGLAIFRTRCRLADTDERTQALNLSF